MMDNTQDKGYIAVTLKNSPDGLSLCEKRIFGESNEEFDFFVDYENGKIYIDWKDGSPKEVIGYYESTVDDTWLAKVFDSTKSRVIGRVGKELIYFRSREADPNADRYFPEEECLAYYTKNGSITAKRMLPYWGFINGSEVGGAAAFVALMYGYNIKSVFRDFYDMDYADFKNAYKSYLEPFWR